MAKKKRRDTTMLARREALGASATTISRRKTTPPTPVVKPAPAAPGGPNRLARKEEARRQREALERRRARRRWYRVGSIVLAVALVAAAITGYFLTRPDPAKAAGCTTVGSTKPFPTSNGNDIDRAHIGGDNGPSEMPPLSEYPSIPPASGPHNATPLPGGVYDRPPDVGQAIHSLEHAAVIIWYSPSVRDSQLQNLRTYVEGDPDHLLLALYDYPEEGSAGELPAGRSLALVAWHHVQLCDSISLDVAKSFVDRFRIRTGGTPPPGYPANGAPEPGSPLA